MVIYFIPARLLAITLIFKAKKGKLYTSSFIDNPSNCQARTEIRSEVEGYDLLFNFTEVKFHIAVFREHISTTIEARVIKLVSHFTKMRLSVHRSW